jgi:hypothetical protein
MGAIRNAEIEIFEETLQDAREGVRPYLVPGRPEWDRAEEWLAEVACHVIHEALYGDKAVFCGRALNDDAIVQVNRITARLYCRAMIIVAEEYGFTGYRVRDLAQTHGLGDLDVGGVKEPAP